MRPTAIFEPEQGRRRRPGSRRGFLRALLRSGAGIGLGGVALLSVARSGQGAAPSWLLADPPLFRLRPNPPSAGRDLEVTYLGPHPEDVMFQVGADGKQVAAKLGPDQSFRIPKELLKAGLTLFLWDHLLGDEGSVAVLIEP